MTGVVANRAFLVPMANRVLDCFAEGTMILWIEGRGVVVTWRQSNGEDVFRRWQTRGQDFYPTWHKQWGHGGTASTALAQLVRWVQGKPVLPLSTWRYWFGDKCRLARNRADEGLQSLIHGGYPETAACVLCKHTISGSMDWWSLKGVTGPCCGWTTGCRQKQSA